MDKSSFISIFSLLTLPGSEKMHTYLSQQQSCYCWDRLLLSCWRRYLRPCSIHVSLSNPLFPSVPPRSLPPAVFCPLSCRRHRYRHRATSGRVQHQPSLDDVIHHCARNNRGLRPLKKSISETGGLGSYLDGTSSRRVSAIAAAEASKAALAGALDNLLACFDLQASPRPQQPPLASPTYSFARPEALGLWAAAATE